MIASSTLDLAIRLPSSWKPISTPRGPVAVQDFAHLLKDLRDYAREQFGAAYAAGFITSTVLEALIKARAMDLLAHQMVVVDGAAFALSVQALLNHLTPDRE